jgi:hypothetical protein
MWNAPCMPERPTDEEVGGRLRQATERLRATLDRSEASRLDRVVDRLTGRYLPPRRPDLRLIQGDREGEDAKE